MSWSECTLDQLGYVSRGRSRHRPRDADFLYGGPYPFIQTSDVKRASLYLTEFSQTYSEAGLAQSKLWPEGTMCITIAANIADTAILGISACFPDSVIGFIPDKKKADPRYIKYYFDAVLKNKFKAFTQGAAQDNLSQEKLFSLKLKIPELEHQSRIADTVSQFDELIENNRRRIALLEEAARMLYREWFVHFRFPGHEHVEIVGGLPAGWEQRALGEITDVRLGKMLDDKKNRGESRPYLANVNVRWGRFDLFDLRTMRFEDREIENYGLAYGDIVMCEGGEPGRCALWKDQVPGMVLQKALHRIRCPAGLNFHFLYYSLSFMAQTGRLAGLYTGATIKHLPREKLVTARVVLPSQSLVRQFSDFVAPLEDQIRTLETAMRRASEARDLLLPRLMSGEIAV